MPNGRHLCVQHTYGWEDVSSFLIQQGEGEVDGDPAARRRGGGGGAWQSCRASPSTAGEEEDLGEGEGCARTLVKLPCASPLYMGVEGAGFLPSKSIGALAKVGGKKSHHFLPHRLLSPLLWILILSLRDMILFLLRGDLGAP